ATICPSRSGRRAARRRPVRRPETPWPATLPCPMVRTIAEENMRNSFNVVAAVAIGLAGLTAASAQTYPSRPVTMIIPFAAGGPTDVLGRLVGQRMGEVLGQQIIIENVGGAGGMTGVLRVAQASPDGYNIVLGTVGTHAQNQTLYKRPLYNAAT